MVDIYALPQRFGLNEGDTKTVRRERKDIALIS